MSACLPVTKLLEKMHKQNVILPEMLPTNCLFIPHIIPAKKGKEEPRANFLTLEIPHLAVSSNGVHPKPWVSILSHGLMTWMIYGYPRDLGNLHFQVAKLFKSLTSSPKGKER